MTARVQLKRIFDAESSSNNENTQISKPRKSRRNLHPSSTDQFVPEPADRCRRCLSVDIEVVYRMDPQAVSSNGNPILEIEQTPASNFTEHCNFCDMVYEIYRRRANHFEKYNICHLRAFSCLSVLGLARTEARLNRSPSLVIAVVSGGAERSIPLSVRDEALASDLILPTTEMKQLENQNQSLMYMGRCIAPDNVNFELVRDWLRECCQEHLLCSKQKHRQDSGSSHETDEQIKLLVIDCQVRSMVRLPPGASYIALSYVWGTWATDPVSETLSALQPLTIEDAICVVKSLGQRYLWIDRYSIDQNDSAAIHQAVLNMDNIFENALLVIVSLGDNVHTGLWGVSSAHRRIQPTATLHGLQVVFSGMVLEDAVRWSKWASRGWTFQEALLSQRMLLFSPEQVYWKCSSITYRESVQQPPMADGRRHKKISAFDPDVFSEASQRRRRFGEMSLPLYAKQVAEYTKRELTFTKDALNAFRGILSRSKELTFYGIPVFMTQEKLHDKPSSNDGGFVLGLLWSRNAHKWYKPWLEYVTADTSPKEIESRREFPSWSWTSTSHCVQFDPLSFDRELSDRHGQLCAVTSRRALYVNIYAAVQLEGQGSLVKTIMRYTQTQAIATASDKQVAESSELSSLTATGLLVPWKVDPDSKVRSLEIQACPSMVDVLLHLPRHIHSTNKNSDWLTQGTVFLDYDSERGVVCQPGFEGTALLLVHYHRHGYNWRHVVWWLALQCHENHWRRIGLIRSVCEIQTPKFSTKDMRSQAHQDHRRPFLPSNIVIQGDAASLPERAVLQKYFQTITVA